MYTDSFFEIEPDDESSSLKGSAYILVENERKKLFTISGRYPNSSIKISDIKEGVNIDFYTEKSERLPDTCLENTKTLTLDESNKYIKPILNFMKYRLQGDRKFEGLLDEVTLNYFREIVNKNTNTIGNTLSETNTTLVNDLEKYQSIPDTYNDILLNYNGHYSSLPIISVNKQRYLFDSAGNLHQNSSGRIEDEIAKRFSGIQSLNPFGLNYQNNSNACGIWSANILNQVQEFKKAVKESEIVKTYTGSDGKPYKILNPEILLRAATQVSKDLTPEGEKPEIKILQEGQRVERDYVPLKIGNTTFAIDTTYKSDRCIDIEAIALSIPRGELSQEIDNQNFIKKQEEIAAKVFSPVTGSLTQEQKRRERLEQICKIRFTPTELINIRPPRSQPPNPQTTLEQKPLLPKPTSNPALKCFNFNVAKQKLEKQQPPQSTPSKQQQKQSILHPQ